MNTLLPNLNNMRCPLSRVVNQNIRSSIEMIQIRHMAHETSPSTGRQRIKPHPPRRAYLYNQYAEHLKARTLLVAQHNNLNVNEFTLLRQQLSPLDARAQVVRLRILQAALRDSPVENLSPLAVGPICLISSETASLTDLMKVVGKHRKILVVGGKAEGALLDHAGLERVASLPGMEQLRAELIGVLQEPTRRLHALLSQNAQNLVFALQQYVEQNQKYSDSSE
ncbi:mitochondrial 54S ribosomal protein uL10m [Calcarisporiella thermophila]|uniref:mitochondrial 54S ribosomal protein uL10m n=1 Tax=Calcarisporiella thermophila TaxID=911321 RepID=UPI003742410D